MASLLYPDEDQSQWPTSLLPVDDGTPPVLQADPRADALGQTYRDVSDYLARQQAKSEAEGYWTGGGLLEGGHPTGKGLLDAIQQTGTAVALGTGAPGDAPPPSFINYHGSPHDFPPTARNPLGEFDPAKIGTGEGAQAFGMGHYTADAEGVARGYRDDLSALSIDGKPMTGTTPAQRLVISNAGDVDKALSDFQAHSDSLTPGQRQRGNIEQTLAELKDMRGRVQPGTGHMYEVQVNADPAHFLDWDKPLSEQHPNVQAALTPEALGLTAFGPVGPKGYYGWADETGKRVGPSLRTGSPGPLFDPKATGQDIYRTLHDNPAVAAEMLQKAGLPGIRYLDAGSRGAGEGSRNSVVFDPATMEIIRKYGLAGLMAGGGAAALSGQQGQQQQ